MNEGRATAEAAEAARPSIWKSHWMNMLGRFAALLAVFTFFALFVPNRKFYTPRNLENIARQSAVYATAAIGMTLVIVAGGIDLSVGSVIALTVVVMAWVLSRPDLSAEANGTTQAAHLIDHWPQLLPIMAIAVGLVTAVVAGLVNGCLIVGLRLVPFIVTLGTMGVIRGLAKGIAHEKDIYPPKDTWLVNVMDPTLTSPDAGRSWMLLPPGIWLLLVAAIVAALMLRYTRLGRHIYAIGSNENTARLCGVPVERTEHGPAHGLVDDRDQDEQRDQQQQLEHHATSWRTARSACRAASADTSTPASLAAAARATSRAASSSSARARSRAAAIRDSASASCRASC